MLVFVAVVAAIVGAVAPQDPAAVRTHRLELGPLRGACDAENVRLWARADAPGRYEIELLGAGSPRVTASDEASEADDLTLHWTFADLRGRAFTGYVVRRDGVEIARDEAFAVRGAMTDDAARSAIAFGSCANERRDAEQDVWLAIAARHPDALLLLGDTPYIDSKKLDGHRKRHREFFAREEIASCLGAVPTYFVWDDHDYTGDGKLGVSKGRDEARRAFLEYRANASFGSGEAGVYHSFRRGPIEVFALDTRWFADTEASPLAAEQKTLLGRAQIEWLQRGLAASSAPFKVLACGMAWNGAVRDGKTDCWGKWLPERDGLLRWIGEQKVGGVVLVGGDLHVARLIRHPTAELCGYDVPECISSPLANSTIEKNAGPLPGVLFDAARTSTFAEFTAERANATDGGDDSKLTVRFFGGDGGELFAHTFALAELTPRPR